MGILDRISEERSSIDTWITDYLLPANQFNYGGHTYGFGQGAFGSPTSGLQTTYDNRQIKEIAASLPNYAQAMKRCPPAFAAECVRAMVLSQARFTFRNKRSVNKKRNIFGTTALSLLENPWTNATTGDLISRMEWHVGLAGNAYVTRRTKKDSTPYLRVLRPDWVATVYGSQEEPDNPDWALDSELIGYIYVNGGFSKAGATAHIILPEDMAHWYPLPDPECANMGMSWITPAVREMQSDTAASEHKLKFFSNAATPNLVVKGIPAVDKTKFDEIVDMLESKHTGMGNAYRTLYLTAGADATVVGSNFMQMDFKNITNAGETRITALSRVPAIMVGLSEGLQGAALNAGNFGQVRRMFADTWVFPELQNLAASLAPLVNVPSDSELWFDVLDMPILREDATDAAGITQIQAATISTLVSSGFTQESAAIAVMANDMSLLVPVQGWISVQLQAKSGATPPADNAPPATGK